MHGEYKMPGGKLVAVDFEIHSGRLRNVKVTGDFFLYPDDALDPLVAALEGLPADAAPEVYAGAVTSALEPGVELVGFSPEAIASAIDRGRIDAAND
jgi:lipoate-protein ligase A